MLCKNYVTVNEFVPARKPLVLCDVCSWIPMIRTFSLLVKPHRRTCRSRITNNFIAKAPQAWRHNVNTVDNDASPARRKLLEEIGT